MWNNNPTIPEPPKQTAKPKPLLNSPKPSAAMKPIKPVGNRHPTSVSNSGYAPGQTIAGKSPVNIPKPASSGPIYENVKTKPLPPKKPKPM